MAAELWTIVPMRGFESGKTRLAAAIDSDARVRLNRWLLVRTLKVIKRWRRGLKRCVVVTPCDQVLELARRAGAAVVRETKSANDLNQALALGASYAAANRAGRVLVLACDLPDLTVEALRALTRAAAHPEQLVLAPDSAGTGTNAMLVAACPDLQFRFGEHSFARHRKWAAARGWPVAVIARPELAFDLDTPEDLAAWLARGAPTDARLRRALLRPSAQGRF